MIHAQDWGGLIEWAHDHGCLPEDARYVPPMRSALIKAVTGAALNPETDG